MLLGTIASHGLGARGGSYDSIATVTVGAGGTSSVEFTSIPQTYKHLQIRWIGKMSGANDQIRVTYNDDSSALYSSHELTGNGSSAYSAATSSQTSIYIFGVVTQSTTLANSFGVGVADILDYANTSKYKTNRSLTGYDNNGGGLVSLMSGLWQSTSAISKITLTPSATGFAQYSHFALYGIKAA